MKDDEPRTPAERDAAQAVQSTDEVSAQGPSAERGALPSPEADAQGADGEASAGARTVGGPGGTMAFFALSLAALAILATSALWWQYRAFYVELSDDDAALNRGLEETRANLRRLDDALAATTRELQAGGDRTAAVGDRVDALQPQLIQLAQRIDALQGGNYDARELWLRAEAEYYLAAANTELEVGGRWQNAIAALELADNLLRELANPALNSVRAAIASELAALRAVRLPDVEGLAFTVSSLAERVPELPMRADSPENFSPGDSELDSMEPGLARLWRGLTEAVVGIVRVERRNDPVDVVLTDAERRVARRQLELELELTRAALARGRQAAFLMSLDAAVALLERDFDRGAPEVASALSALAELRRTDVAPARPDISRSLSLLRAAPRDDR